MEPELWMQVNLPVVLINCKGLYMIIAWATLCGVGPTSVPDTVTCATGS